MHFFRNFFVTEKQTPQTFSLLECMAGISCMQNLELSEISPIKAPPQIWYRDLYTWFFVSGQKQGYRCRNMASLCPVAPFFCPNKLSGGPSSCFAITIWPKCQLQKKPLQNQRRCPSHTTQPFQCQNGSWNNEMMLFAIFVKMYGHNWKTAIVSSLNDKWSGRFGIGKAEWVWGWREQGWC